MEGPDRSPEITLELKSKQHTGTALKQHLREVGKAAFTLRFKCGLNSRRMTGGSGQLATDNFKVLEERGQEQ